MSANLLLDLDSYYDSTGNRLSSGTSRPDEVSTLRGGPFRPTHSGSTQLDLLSTSAQTTTSSTQQQQQLHSSTYKGFDRQVHLPVQPEQDEFGHFESAHTHVAFAKAPRTLPPKARANHTASKIRDENVLFDAEDEFDGDDADFGDFEQGQDLTAAQPLAAQPQPLPKKHQSPSLIDFEEASSHLQELDVSSEAPQSSSLAPALSPSGPKVDPVIGKAASVTRPNASRTPARSSSIGSPAPEENADSWPDFGDDHQDASLDRPWQARETQPETGDAHSTKAESCLIHPEVVDGLLAVPHTTTASAAPPINIPPPAILLTLFPPILSTAQKTLFEPLARHGNSSPTRHTILNDDLTRKYLDSLLTIGRVLGHIVAGRKLRWKRDTMLGQSMRIGPASGSRGGGGMKLASVDRGEASKEDKEVADAVRVWRNQAGRLRSIVTASATTGNIPDVAETPPVRLAQASEGGMSSKRQCALCGLKRNERVPKVDVNVEDSFGEWWVEHWGHQTCLRFWEAQSKNLTSR